MYVKYPNLELLEYKTKLFLKNNEEFNKKIEKLKETKNYVVVDFEAKVFLQVWGNACTGFDIIVNKNGIEEPAIGGSAMTEEYTTVMYERNTETYIIYFGDRMCYMVSNANEKFLSDLKNSQLEGLKRAKELY